MFGFGRTAHEFITDEPLALAVVHDAIEEFLRNRDDVVISGSQAVNFHVTEPRMTQDVDMLSTCALDLAEELAVVLCERFESHVTVRASASGLGFRLFQERREKNRHVADLRQVPVLPSHQMIKGVRVVTPETLLAMKVCSYASRIKAPKAGTDWRDIAVLLLQFPQFKTAEGEVQRALLQMSADPAALALWEDIVKREIIASDESEEEY